MAIDACDQCDSVVTLSPLESAAARCSLAIYKRPLDRLCVKCF